MKTTEMIIKVKGDIGKFLSKCLYYNLTLLNINYLDKENILVKIKKNDYPSIKKIGYFCEISKYKYLGIDALIFFVKKNLISLIGVICCFILMGFIENIIVKIDIIHSNKDIVKLVEKELNHKGIKSFMYKMDFDKLNKIKNEIVEENPDKIEWMSITRQGMKYIVRVEERILNEIKTEEGYCHVVAKKAGIIKKIISSKGEIIPRVDDYVKKDDLLISGEIKLYEEVKDNTCANGIVMAEVWYKVNLTIPLNYWEKEYTGNKRYNFIINNKKVFKEKYKLYEEKELNKLKIRDFRVYYIEEQEYREHLVKYTEKEALEKALINVEEKMKVKLGKKGEVITKKVLKNSLIDSKMEVEVVVVALEDIATVVNYEPKVGEESDTE